MRFNGTGPVDINYHGINLRIRPFDNTIESRILFSSKFREKKEIEAIKKHVNQSTLFLDIGANSGYYSIWVASFGARKVVSFDPNPDMIARIQENSKINNFENTIQTSGYALGDTDDVVTLQIATLEAGLSAITKSIEHDKEIEVRQLTLQSAMRELSESKPDIIKIDVEGMEDKVLLPYLRNLKPEHFPNLIIIEDNENDWEENVVDWLLSNGYRKTDATRGNLILSR